MQFVKSITNTMSFKHQTFYSNIIYEFKSILIKANQIYKFKT